MTEQIISLLQTDVFYWLSVSLMTLLGAFVLLVMYAHLPFGAIGVLRRSSAPDRIKRIGTLQFMKNSAFALLITPIDLLSPLVVPVLLMFTRWDSEKLGILNSVWGNDASINGDVRDSFGNLVTHSLDKNDQQAIDSCYWSPGNHPRSFKARYTWLGLRNRASALCEKFGADVVRGLGPDADYEQWITSPDDFDGWNLSANPDRETSIVRKVLDKKGRPVVSVFSYTPSKLFNGMHVRRYFGYKIPLQLADWDKSLPALVGWSIRKVKPTH